MNNSFSLQQTQKSGNLDANLISRQKKLNLMPDLMRVEYKNPKMKQSEIASLMGLPSSTLQRYRNDINLLSPYKINPNNFNKRTKKTLKTNFDNNSHCDPDLKRPQMKSNNLKTSSNETVGNKKNKLKGESKIQINEHYLDEILHNNNL